MSPPAALPLSRLRSAAERLLRQAGFQGSYALSPIRGGGNNRAYRIGSGKAVLFLKAYFRHPDDPRDRLGREFAFARFAWERGIRCLPEPLACDRENALALFTFVEGKPPAASRLDRGMVQSALGFYRAVNLHRDSREAASLPEASEACFSLSEHFSMVESRLKRLTDGAGSSRMPAEASRFILGDLSEAVRAERLKAARLARDGGIPLDRPLPVSERCLSPSDFGFHNALLAEGGALRFIDFEYAGWDDPAKLVCDFFCQPKVPVPDRFYPVFSEGVASLFPSPDLPLRRMELLMPLYRLKWCCILLNEFTPAGARRRSFAGSTGLERRRAQQLRMAKTAFSAIPR